MSEAIVMTQSNEATASLFGAFDANIKIVENAFNVKVSNRNNNSEIGDAIVVSGEAGDVKNAVRVLEYLKRMIGDGETLSEQSIEYVKPIRMVFTPSICSKLLIIGILPPRRAANGRLPNATSKPCSAAL